MASFDYIAVDAAGRTRAGALTAANEAEARALLARRRLAAMRVTPASKAAPKAKRAGAIGGRDLALVTRQLATLIAVAPLEESLRTLAAQAEKPKLRQVLEQTHAGVLEGRRLADAMGRTGRAWPTLYRAMVAAGESSGALPMILERLADLLETEQQVKAKVLTALVYPIALTVVALVVVAALMIFVVPKVVDQFESMGQALPLLTRLVIGASDLMRHWGWLIALTLLGAGALFAHWLRKAENRLRFDRWVLRLPVVGRLIRDLHAARLARTLATMLASGLPVVEGLTAVSPTVRNAVLRQATEQMAAAIREGGGLSSAMRRAGVFPPLLVHMTASGESSGRLEPMLERSADYLDREFNAFTAAALSLLEPIIIVVMGGVVAVIVLSILLPILQINTLAVG
ncbi:type II secretion system inner membrane protein GspF [Brevundimonas sp. 2R-24]|uniref:General secretion pathway protein F n=1 Tax=Peiella sedimenti TaxID=3061083 RepID=A0ABT8SJ24_9CAUL|nr:type II secretion system inner membrane protein GspF [Caulobacteraceae bacterium XZ-24]